MTIEELEIVVRANITDAVKGMQKLVSEVKQAVAQSMEPVKKMTMQVRNVATQSAPAMSKMKSQMKNYCETVKETTKQQELLKSKINDLKASLNMPKGTFTKTEILEMEAELEKLENRLQNLQKQGNKTNIIGNLKSQTKSLTNFKKAFEKSIAKPFSNGVKSIKRFALSLLSVRTAFTGISKAAQSYLSFDSQLSSSIQNCWNVLGSLLAPILESVIGLFSKAVSYINAFVTALTGINLVARANAKALNNQGKAAKKASESQSSLDEFHNISKDNNSGGSGVDNSISVENVDTSKLQPFLDLINKIKEDISSINFQPLIDSFANIGNSLEFLKSGIIDLAKDFYNNFLLPLSAMVIENVLPDFLNATAFALSQIDFQTLSLSFNMLYESLLPFTEDIFSGLKWFYEEVLIPLGLWVMNDVVPAFLNLLSGAIRFLHKIIEDFKPIFKWLWDNALEPLAKWTGGIIVDVLNGIGDALKWISENEVAMAILEGIAIAIGLVAGAIAVYNGVMAVCNIVTGIFSGILAVLTSPITLVVAALAGLIAIIILCVKHWDEIKEAAINCWNKIKEVWNVVAIWFNEHIVQPVKGFFAGMWNGLKEGAQNAWIGIKNIFSSVTSFFKNIFGNAWNAVKNIFSAGGKVFSGIKDGIFNAFRNVVNVLIAGINKVVAIPFNAINGALRTIRNISFLGIAPFKGLISLINVPQIPKLAKGGVFDRETTVTVAEYSNARSNQEIISPRDIMKETMVEALEETKASNERQQVDVNITGKLTAEGSDLVYVYDKTKNEKGYDGKNNPSFAY